MAAAQGYFGTGPGVTVASKVAAPSDGTMDVDVGEGAHESVAVQGGAGRDYDNWDSSESDDDFYIQTDRSQEAEDDYTLDFNQNIGKRIVMTLKKK